VKVYTQPKADIFSEPFFHSLYVLIIQLIITLSIHFYALSSIIVSVTQQVKNNITFCLYVVRKTGSYHIQELNLPYEINSICTSTYNAQLSIINSPIPLQMQIQADLRKQ